MYHPVEAVLFWYPMKDSIPAGEGMGAAEGFFQGWDVLFVLSYGLQSCRSSQWVQGPARGIVATPLRPERPRGQTCALGR